MRTKQSFWSRILTCMAAVLFCASPAWADYTQSDFNRSFTYIFLPRTGATSATTYDDINNWSTYADSAFTVATGNLPGVSYSSGSRWSPTLIDGSLFNDTTLASDAATIAQENGYYEISASTLEGWNLQLGVANSVHLTISTLNKIAGGGTHFVYVDDTSKLTIGTFGASNNAAVTDNWYVWADEGIVLQSAFNGAGSTPTINLNFDEDGSIAFANSSGTAIATGATAFNLASVVLNLGDATLLGKQVISRKLIGYASTTGSITTSSASVTLSATSGDVSSLTATASDTALAATDALGTYRFYSGSDGFYVEYVGYSADVNTYARTLDGTAGSWSETDAWTSNSVTGTSDVPTDSSDVTVTVNADTTLTMNAASSIATLTVNGGTETSGALTFAAATVGDGWRSHGGDDHGQCRFGCDGGCFFVGRGDDCRWQDAFDFQR